MNDELLKHYGVKGMRWGVSRTKEQLSKAGNAAKSTAKKAAKSFGDGVKARRKKKNAKLIQIADKYHEKHKGKKSYNRAYRRNLKKFSKYKTAHHKAVLQTRKDIVNRRVNNAVAVLSIAGPSLIPSAIGAAGLAGMGARAVARKVATPSNIIRGKNIVMALKRSPVRYADVSKYKNIINPK